MDCSSLRRNSTSSGAQEVPMPESKESVDIINLTASRVRIEGHRAEDGERVLIAKLAPLERRRVEKGDDWCSRAAGIRPDALSSEPVEEKSLQERLARLWMVVALASFVVFIGAAAVVGAMTPDGGAESETTTVDDNTARIVIVWVAASVLWLLIVGFAAAWLLRNETFADQVLWFKQLLSFFATALIGIIIPVAVMMYFGGGLDLLREDPSSLAWLGRLLQTGFVITAALLPAVLYFIFDRNRLGTQRLQFERSIFRLDPDITSLVDLEAKYGATLREVLGERSAENSRLRHGTRWPILFATAIISVGWIFTMLPVGEIGVTEPTDLLSLFDPPERAAVFGFLGAYFYAITMVSRNYVRGDLRPKTYSAITVRIVTVTIFAWVAEALLPQGSYLYGAMFVVGILPDTFWTITKGYTLNAADRVPEHHPLTVLEGVDLYDRSRLLDEGVTNVEGLAHGDLVQLLVETRIPVGRLIDWVDQAILHLHLDQSAADSIAASGRRGRRVHGREYRRRQRTGSAWDTIIGNALRAKGIRTASDLIVALELSLDRQELLQELNLDWAFIDALYDDEWVSNILYWRTPRSIDEISIALPDEVATGTAEDADEQSPESVLQGVVAAPPAHGEELIADLPSECRDSTDSSAAPR